MAEVLPTKHSLVLHSESVALGASAETLADAGATIPQTTGIIVVTVPTGSTNNMHYLSSETPTSTLGNRLTHGHPAEIPHHLQKRVQFVADDGADVTCNIIYFRGGGRQDLAYTQTEPF
jgi:hypothetical protein